MTATVTVGARTVHLDDLALARIARRTHATQAGCAIWTGPLDRDGYAIFGRRSLRVHRLTYQLHRGPIPTGLVLHHVCGNRACVRPEHLEPLTPRENTLRSVDAPAAILARRTACPAGHPLTAPNVYVWRGHRSCLACRRARSATWRRHADAPGGRGGQIARRRGLRTAGEPDARRPGVGQLLHALEARP